MAHAKKQPSKDATVCDRLLRGCLAACRAALAIVEKLAEREQVGLVDMSVTLSMCNAALSSVFNPIVLPLFLSDVGFQSWTLVLFELLSLLKWKFEHSMLHSTLEMSLRGPRLRLFFDRLEAKISAHVGTLRPFLDVLDSPMLAVRETEGRQAFDTKVQEQLKRNGGVMRVEHLIEDEDGKSWWLDQFGCSTYAVAWAKFEDRLANHPDEHVRTLAGHPEVLGTLRETISPQQRKAVTLFQWSEFLWSYGPGVRVALIQMIASSRSAPWFAGALSYDEARSVLTPFPGGTFLIRFSESAVCTWAVSYANEVTGVINHALVQAVSPDPLRPGGAGPDDYYFRCGQKRYRSFAEIVAVNAGQLRHPAPNVKNLGPARCFRDFLTFEEAEDMLRGQRAGTFLIRFSINQEGCLVVAYVTAEGAILQSKIYCEPERGFVLGGQVYKRIPDMIKQNRTKLRYPLAVQYGGGWLDLDAEDMDETIMSNHVGARERRAESGNYGALDAAGSMRMSAEATYLPLGEVTHSDGWPADKYYDASSAYGSVALPGDDAYDNAAYCDVYGPVGLSAGLSDPGSHEDVYWPVQQQR